MFLESIGRKSKLQIGSIEKPNTPFREEAFHILRAKIQSHLDNFEFIVF